MCEPTTALAVASLAATAIGGYVQYQGQKQAASSAQAMAEYEAGVARNNAIASERFAVDAEQRGTAAEQEQRLKTRQLLARQRVGFAANNVQLGSGAVIGTLGDTAAFGELDALTIKSNAQREAFGFRMQGSNFQAESGLARARGATAKSEGRMAALGTALNTAGTVASKWYTFDQAGAFSFSKSKVPTYPVSPATKTGGAL
ncbi:MAG: hypothetical protein O2884_08575 [Chloroflexi bacterium]|nr:hypothetical protein [Chloroflexota bacterium]